MSLPSRLWGDGENPSKGNLGVTVHCGGVRLKEGVVDPGCGAVPRFQEADEVDAPVYSRATLTEGFAPRGSGWQPNGR